MGDRKTPYKYPPLGLDLAEIVRTAPKLCRICYRGKWYHYATCFNRECRKEFWHRYGDANRGREIALMKHTYCSDICSITEQKRLRDERQIRWRENNPEAYQASKRRAYLRAREKLQLVKKPKREGSRI
jgi:hypothetical protein